MRALRDTLKVIFYEESADVVIRKLLDGESKLMMKMPVFDITHDTLIPMYLHTSPSYTQDQAEASLEMARSQWMQRKDCGSFMYASRRNVFNVLLHFTSQVLIRHGEEPVCRFDNLLQWHEITHLLGEDLFTTAFLASSDASYGRSRSYFSWPFPINHDNAALLNLCGKRMADIHNHLNGTGFLCELNWLSLMNDVTGRWDQFNKSDFQSSKYPKVWYSTSSENKCSLYVNVIKAAAIRLFLFMYSVQDDSTGFLLNYSELLEILRVQSDTGILSYLGKITSYISTMKLMYARCHHTCLNEEVIIDYAVLKQGDFSRANPVDNINFIMSGERRLMYRISNAIYRDEDSDGRLSSLLYTYLLIKNEFMRELVQTNNSKGFGNFHDYQNRKAFFLRKGSVYESLLVQSAIISSLGFGSSNTSLRKRYLETRISPCDSSLADARKIKSSDRLAHYVIEDSSIILSQKKEEWKGWDYVFHFIKEKEKKVEIPRPRNSKVRSKVKRQAMALDMMRCYNYYSARRIVGIDAASSEFSCRPEVFAHAFRFLRESQYPSFIAGPPLPSLGVTYHVGEDFYDIIDGLRAVREAILFLQLHSGDRIGHGLVLGTNVRNYYQKRHWSITMPKQCILDNVTYLFVEAQELDGFENVHGYLERLFLKYFNSLYGDLYGDVSPMIYYQAWLLRGDDPEQYLSPDEVNDSLGATPWERARFDLLSREICDARKIKIARQLNHLYHYDRKVKEIGQKTDQVELTEELINLIILLQEKILCEIERKGISIECNPTSNFKIGDIQQFREHPITTFYSLPSSRTSTQHQIGVTVNTDDKGVFSTSLEREFALLAAAIHQDRKNGQTESSPREVLKWLDDVREMAFEMRFNHDT